MKRYPRSAARFVTVVVITSAAASVIAQQANNPVVPPPGTTIHRDVAYVADGHERQRLDLYLPGSTSGRRPLIIAVHGGAWTGGDKNNHANTAWITPILLNAGYPVASLNYRFSNHAVFPAQIHDVKAAVRFLREQAAAYQLDPARFGAWGASSGAYLVTLLGTSAGVGAMEGTQRRSI